MNAIGEPVEIRFVKGEATLSQAAKIAMAQVARILTFYPLYSAVLTAGAAPGEKSPAALAGRRVAAVTRYLTGPGGVEPHQLMVVVKPSRHAEVTALIVDRPIPGL